MTDATIIEPATADRWDDLVDLFGPERGAYGGCWCMYWRMAGTGKSFQACPRETKRDAFHAIVADGAVAPGLIAYRGGVAVGWVAVAPRSVYPRFNATKASRAGDEVDMERTWAITCFYVRAGARRSGLMEPLIRAAVGHDRANGAAAVDAAPLDVARKLIPAEGYVGVASAFRRVGFKVVARNSTARPLMRLVLARLAA